LEKHSANRVSTNQAGNAEGPAGTDMFFNRDFTNESCMEVTG